MSIALLADHREGLLRSIENSTQTEAVKRVERVHRDAPARVPGTG